MKQMTKDRRFQTADPHIVARHSVAGMITMSRDGVAGDGFGSRAKRE
jgi:hypothetical protein